MALEHSILPAEGERRLSLVFLHGMGGRLRDWSFLQIAFDLPWLEMILPQGPYANGKGWAWFDLDERYQKTDLTHGNIAESRDLVLDLVRHLDRPPGSLVLGGFSQGCTISLDTALRMDLPLAGVLGISGCLPQLSDYPEAFCPSARTRRILATHGQWDKTIPLRDSREQFDELRAMGVGIEFEVFDKGHTLDLDEEVPRIRTWLEGCLPG